MYYITFFSLVSIYYSTWSNKYRTWKSIYEHIINGITILDCSFVEMEVLKPIYMVISMLGIQILKPFHELLIHPETNYPTLLNLFSKLYGELTSIEVHKKKYPQEIKRLITLCLKKFADSLAHQKGAIFGFSNKPCRDTGLFWKFPI